MIDANFFHLWCDSVSQISNTTKDAKMTDADHGDIHVASR